jgi:hypothetical protein
MTLMVPLSLIGSTIMRPTTISGNGSSGIKRNALIMGYGISTVVGRKAKIPQR